MSHNEWRSLPGGINHLMNGSAAYCGLKGKDWRLPWEPGMKCRKCQVAYERANPAQTRK